MNISSDKWWDLFVDDYFIRRFSMFVFYKNIHGIDQYLEKMYILEAF